VFPTIGLAERIASDPIFLQTGGFDRQFFRQVLRSYGITEDEFVTDTRSFAARQQLALGLVGGMGQQQPCWKSPTSTPTNCALSHS
jgi:hypothetical protein